jgi:hypothetical protein
VSRPAGVTRHCPAGRCNEKLPGSYGTEAPAFAVRTQQMVRPVWMNPTTSGLASTQGSKLLGHSGRSKLNKKSRDKVLRGKGALVTRRGGSLPVSQGQRLGVQRPQARTKGEIKKARVLSEPSLNCKALGKSIPNTFTRECRTLNLVMSTSIFTSPSFTRSTSLSAPGQSPALPPPGSRRGASGR